MSVLASSPRAELSAGQGQLPWLFSPAVDLSAFLGSAVVAWLLLAVGAWQGILHSDSPEWTWVTAVLLVDVAHVYATAFRVFADREELRQRRWLYVLTPLLGFLIGWALHSESPLLFWRVLAYLAVFHFVRQQYGWVALYRARGKETDRGGKWIDSAAIYSATVFPLLWWHAHLPRAFDWFIPNDFLGLSTTRLASGVSSVREYGMPIVELSYWMILATYFGRSLLNGVRLGRWNPGKDIVVLTTAICWYVGIITFNSDYAFTVTNVIIHGVPYFVLVYWYRYRRTDTAGTKPAPAARRWRRILMFVGLLWLLAYVEELLWDRGVWHQRAWLFGSGWDLSGFKSVLVPLLAVPQLTHYILDGFLWKRRSNPEFQRTVES